MKDLNQKKEIKNHLVKIGVLLIAIVILGVSLTYAYYNAKLSGESNVDNQKAANFKVTSTLTSANVINDAKMSLIDAANINTEADKVEFSVTNDVTSTVSGKYFVYLTELKISKNLYSKYFKWQLVRKTSGGESIIDSGDFSKAIRTDATVPGEATNVLTTVQDIGLNKVALVIPKSTTDNLIFRIWIENNPSENQVDLTNGAFEGKLKIDATPSK